MSPRVDEPPPPGNPEARALGCICSPNQNRNGASVVQPGIGVMFIALYWCPLHGIMAKEKTKTATGGSRSGADGKLWLFSMARPYRDGVKCNQFPAGMVGPPA
jgi:hypothetical protein